MTWAMNYKRKTYYSATCTASHAVKKLLHDPIVRKLQNPMSKTLWSPSALSCALPPSMISSISWQHRSFLQLGPWIGVSRVNIHNQMGSGLAICVQCVTTAIRLIPTHPKMVLSWSGHKATNLWSVTRMPKSAWIPRLLQLCHNVFEDRWDEIPTCWALQV